MKTPTVQRLLDGLNEFMPFSLAEKWDNVGLMVGHPNTSVGGVLLGLDPCLSLFEEAVSLGLNTVLTHHPLLFHPVKKVDLSTVQGRLISFALSHKLQILCCHTNFDQVAGGVSNLLAKKLGVCGGGTLTVKECDGECGFGWLGDLATPVAGTDFLQLIADKLQQPNLLIAGRVPKDICRVAVCGGSCGDFSELAMDRGADIFITSEIKHSQARWAEDAGMCLVDAGHFATENLAMVGLRHYLVQSMGFTNVQLSQTQERPLRGYLESCVIC